MSNVTLAGVTFSPSDFNNYGWLNDVTVGGTSYIRILALFAAAMADLGKALTVSATGSINFDTIIVNDTGSITLGENRPYRTNSVVSITDSSNTGNFIVARVTNDVTATTLNYTVLKVTTASAGGTGTTFTVQITGEIGATGATGPAGADGENPWNTPRFLDTADHPITALDKDLIFIDTSVATSGVASVIVYLPSSGRVKIVDSGGSASTTNILVTPESGQTATFDTIDTNYFSGEWHYNSTTQNWELG